MKTPCIALPLLALALASPAQAQKIYKCKNDKGETFYTQSYDPVRCAGGGAQLNEQGVAVRQIPRVKTAEEIAAEKAAAAAKAEADRIAAEQKAADQVLLMSYATEEDLVRAHQQEVQMFDTTIETAKLQVENQQRTLADLLGAAAESERAKKPVPENIARSIATVRSQIEQQNALILRKEQERAESAREAEQRLARYRKLIEEQSASKH
jgi:hypothetical protein